MRHNFSPDRLWTLVEKGPACWLYRRPLDEKGYGRMCVNGRMTLVHRLAWELTNGPIPTGLLVCHTCDTPACCNPAHLWLGTNAENMADMKAKGRGRNNPEWIRQNTHITKHIGEAHGRAILTESDVRDIRIQHADGVSQTALARQLGIGQSHVSRIVRRTLWSHVA